MSINKTYGYQHWKVRASRWVDILEKNQETTNDAITFESRDCKKTLYTFETKVMVLSSTKSEQQGRLGIPMKSTLWVDFVILIYELMMRS